MTEKESDIDNKESSIHKIADVVVILYKDAGLQKFLPTLNKGSKKRGGKSGGMNVSKNAQKANLTDSILHMHVPYELRDIPGHPQLDAYLKKAMTYHFVPKKVIVSEDSENLKQAINILKAQIAGQTRTNSDGSLDESIKQKTGELEILQKRADEFNTLETSESHINYKEIAAKALRLLSKNDSTSLALYNLIREEISPMAIKKGPKEIDVDTDDTNATHTTVVSNRWRSLITSETESTEVSFGFERKFESRGFDSKMLSDKSSRGIGLHGSSHSKSFGGFDPHRFSGGQSHGHFRRSDDRRSDDRSGNDRRLDDRGGNDRRSDDRNGNDRFSRPDRPAYSKPTHGGSYGSKPEKVGSYVPPHLRQEQTTEKPAYIKTERRAAIELDEADFPKVGTKEESRVIIISNTKLEEKKLLGSWKVKLSTSVLTSKPDDDKKDEVVTKSPLKEFSSDEQHTDENDASNKDETVVRPIITKEYTEISTTSSVATSGITTTTPSWTTTSWGTESNEW